MPGERRRGDGAGAIEGPLAATHPLLQLDICHRASHGPATGPYSRSSSCSSRRICCTRALDRDRTNSVAMRWIAILVAVAAGASAFTPGASSKKLLRATPENALSKSIAKGAGQVALAVALLSPAAAAYGYSSDRQLKVTFGANNPTYFDLPAKASPKGTPFFGGSKEPRTLFKPPKPRVPPRLSRLRATRPRLRAQDPRVQETAASAPPRPRASRVGPSHRAAAPQVSESGWRSKTKGCKRAPPTWTSIAPSDSRAKWRRPGKEGRSPARPEPGARCSPYPVSAQVYTLLCRVCICNYADRGRVVGTSR